MAMQIHGNYDPSRSDYAEKLKEKQAAERAEKAKEAAKAADAKRAGKLPEPQDEYISSEKEGKKPTGLYRVGQDENGNRKIFFDDPKKANRAAEEEEPEKTDRAAEKEKPKEANRAAGKEEPKEEICVGDTNAVDREIKKLKEKKQQLEQQIQSASGDEKKIRELEKKLAQVEQELSQKDTETYRRQHTVFS